MDLDNEELESTRKLNGASKENSIEEDIKIIQDFLELNKSTKFDWISEKHYDAIKNILAERERLIDENKNYEKMQSAKKIKQY